MATRDLVLEWKEGDRGPSQILTLTDANGDAVNLTNAAEIDWQTEDVMTGEVATAPLVEASSVVDGQVVDAAGGQVRRQIDEATDTAAPGTWRLNIPVVFSDGTRQTYPEDRYVWIIVRPDLSA